MSKGYNVTVLSPDNDVSIAKLHYIHMDQVYDAIHSKEVNLVDMGDQNAFSLIAELAQFRTETCVGQVKSNGWKELENYPNDFKVKMIKTNTDAE